jgi:hypothetical protein
MIMHKVKIPKALREQVWIKKLGKTFSAKCSTPWCKNMMTVFDFQCGHDIPESKGGDTILENLIPICTRCNLSMSNVYTFKEWKKLSRPLSKWNRFLIWMIPSLKLQYVTKETGTKSHRNRTNPSVKPQTLLGDS